ncbi:HAD family hydrolase [Lichenicoccus sp.]|uniref:HAD family hydrolase n=1 Tax=Lichenicoccus sp. TaxID=2781899 RepID=UPI003D0D1AE6
MRRPHLVTFDIFGTVIDWRTGLETSCRKAGRPLRDGEFDRVVDVQGELEQGDLDYATVTQLSLTHVLGLDQTQAAVIGAAAGTWPLYPDAPVLRALMRIAPCGAMTNSDRHHGQEIQARLGFSLDIWLCAEDIRLYKPNPEFWLRMGDLRGLSPSADWWHVSAYADYDLGVANALGLTTVLVTRPHSRPGPSSHVVADLNGLAALLSAETE